MAKAIPEGFTAITPYLIVKDVKAQIDFLTRAFDATVNAKFNMPDGGIGHAEMTVLGSRVMMGQAGEKHPEMPAMLYLYVADADAVHARAVAAGGILDTPVKDHFHGDRAGSVKDMNGNAWWIGTRKEDLTPDEIMARMMSQKQK